MGSDNKPAAITPEQMQFQSTLPAWGATPQFIIDSYIDMKISIHAPRMGSDLRAAGLNPILSVFQSTLPAWGATQRRACAGLPLAISIHAPRMGSDMNAMPVVVRVTRFQSTLPAWGATEAQNVIADTALISIHAPRMGSDSTVKAYSNDRIKWSTLREPHFFYSKNACFSPIVSMCAATSRTKKSENQSFIRIISRLGAYVFHLRLVSIPQIIEPYTVRLLVHQHFQCGTK